MTAPKKQMIVNSLHGEECRIAVLENDRLEEFYAERSASLEDQSHVGNIYLAKVLNVEASIQAAFLDFGIGKNGFLHVSDLHPMYFPSGDQETAERVGQKTPHRDRPPIQKCLKRGQEVVVQVLKEGIGTKGPTLTSYLSIPGRYLVIMPSMKRSGVSRKFEDYEQRRELRQVLDSLELPDDFGFILRTAAIGRPKAELKRDLAYLQRLWKAIQKKQNTCKAPCELYTESDLLIRTIRDVMSTEINQIIIDDTDSLKRVEEFLRIVAPRRKSADLIHYDQPVPIFHQHGIEEQILRIHARQVPLPSGGSLVIDQTEAIVAIDVNSGRMKASQDAETTAYKTNGEAVDEITRQLRLRDLGGIVVLDLIDMRSAARRRDIENRLRDLLKRDRAKTEYSRISRFGVIEMTRQRMRPSLGSSYFMQCPTCQGRAYIKTAEVSSIEAIRELAYLIHHPRITRVEMVVSDVVAGGLLSRYRRRISILEDSSGKPVSIRVSKAIPSDRVDFYAYDESGNDVDLAALKPLTEKPKKRPTETKPQSAVEDESSKKTTSRSKRKKKTTHRSKETDQQQTQSDTDSAQGSKKKTTDEVSAEPRSSTRKISTRRKITTSKELDRSAPKSVSKEPVTDDSKKEQYRSQEKRESADESTKKKTRRKRSKKSRSATGTISTEPTTGKKTATEPKKEELTKPAAAEEKGERSRQRSRKRRTKKNITEVKQVQEIQPADEKKKTVKKKTKKKIEKTNAPSRKKREHKPADEETDGSSPSTTVSSNTESPKPANKKTRRSLYHTRRRTKAPRTNPEDDRS